MYREISGKLDAGNRRFAIVASRFNDFITGRLVEGAMDCILRHGGSEENVTVARVPGAFEIPLAASKLAKSGRYEAVICLGAIIRGATPHFDYVASEVAKGVAQVAMQTGVPAIFGVITADTIEQAIERAGTKSGNKGADAAAAAIEMANLFGKLPKNN